MRETPNTKQSLALLGALVMVLSVAAMGFAGTAAANVQSINDLTVSGDSIADNEDSTAGSQHKITLGTVQSDQSTGTIEIYLNDSSGNMVPNDAITSASSNDPTNLDITSTSNDNPITIDLSSTDAKTDDIEVTVQLNTNNFGSEGETFTYEAESDSTSGTIASDSFTIEEERPELNAATVNTSTPKFVNLTFDNPVDASSFSETDFDTADVSTGTSATGFQASDGSEVNQVSSTEVSLELDTAIKSTDSFNADPELVLNNPTTPLTSEEGDVAVKPISTEITNNALPTPTSISVKDVTPGYVNVTYQEDVTTNASVAKLGEAFSLNADAPVSVNETSGHEAPGTDTDEIGVNLTGDVSPGDNIQLSYSDRFEDASVHSDLSGNANATDFGLTAVSNKVRPSIQNVNITSDRNSSVLVTFDSQIQTKPSASDATNNFGSFGLGGISVASTPVTVDQTGRVAEIPLDGDVTAANGDTQIDLGAASSALRSTSGADVNDGSNTESVTNDVKPFITDVSVNAKPNNYQLTVSYSEDISDNATDNIDTEVTDAFSISDPNNVGYRIHNGSVGTSTLTLTMATANGDEDPYRVSPTDDLGDLTYTPDAGVADFPIAESVDGVAASSDTVNINNPVQPVITDATLVTNQSSEPSLYDLEVTFDANVEQQVTESQLLNEFSLDGVNAKITSYTNGQDKGLIDITGNTVTIAVEDTNGDDDLSEIFNANPSVLDYNADTAAEANVPLTANGNAVKTEDDFTVNSPNVEVAGGTVYQSGGTKDGVDTERDRIFVAFSEEITTDSPAESEFTIVNANADASDLEVTGTVQATQIDDPGSPVSGDETFVVTTNREVTDADVFDIEYDPADSAGIEDGGGNDLTETTSADVSNNIGANPKLQDVYIDDFDNTQIVLEFDKNVEHRSTSDNVGGVDFSFPDDNSIGIQSVDGITDNNGADSRISIDFTYASTGSEIEDGDTIPQEALTISSVSPADLGISLDGDENVDIENPTDSETNVDNRIVDGELQSVSEVNIYRADTTRAPDVLGVDAQISDIDVEIKGTTNSEGHRVNDNIKVELPGDTEDGTISTNRFSDSLTVEDMNSVSPSDVDISDITAGQTSTVAVENDGDTRLGTNTTATFVHEARSVGQGYSLTSLPHNGTIVTGSDIASVRTYDGNAGEFDDSAFDDLSDINRTHRGIFIEGTTANSEYGTAYKTDGRDNFNAKPMETGWHVVGANFDLGSSGGDRSLNQDLGFATGVDVPPNNVLAQDPALNGYITTGTATTNDDVAGEDVHYVYLHQQQTRPMIDADYTGSA